MTSVGTPIYVAPEVMKGNSYDATADSYSFGICLVAMIRGEKDVMAFYFQALRKTMKRKSTKGCGVAILNSRMYGKREWRPLLPVEFELSYPKLCKLLKRCWAPLKEDRPGFDEIVKTMQGEVAEEVMRKEEPVITIYKDEPDSIYHERMGKDEQFEDFGEEGMDTTKMVCQRVHTETLEKKDAVIKELQGVHAASLEKKERIHAETLETLEKKKEAVIEKRDAVIKELQARVKSFEDAKDEGEDKM